MSTLKSNMHASTDCLQLSFKQRDVSTEVHVAVVSKSGLTGVTEGKEAASELQSSTGDSPTCMEQPAAVRALQP